MSNWLFSVVERCGKHVPLWCSSFFIVVSNIVSECVIMHAKASLFQNFLSISKLFQIPSECTIYRPCFILFSAVPNRFQYHQNAPFTVLVSFYSLQSKIVSNTVRMHHLPSLFHFILCSPKSFQILWEYMKVCKGLCNKYILNTERKVFTYLWLNYVEEGLHYSRGISILSLANVLKFNIISFKTCLKNVPKCSCGDVGYQNFRVRHAPDPPLEQWCLHIDLSLATPLNVAYRMLWICIENISSRLVNSH